MASIGALRRLDAQGNWITMGHTLVAMPSEADLANLVTDAETGQFVFCEAEQSFWVFDGTTHIPLTSSPTGWREVDHHAGTGPATVQVTMDWTAFSRYRVTIEVADSELVLPDPSGVWQGIQVSTSTGASRYHIPTGDVLGPQGRWTGGMEIMRHFGSLDATVAFSSGEVIRVDAESIWLAIAPAQLTFTIASGDYDILVEAHA